jgi:hypothetical protein
LRAVFGFGAVLGEAVGELEYRVVMAATEGVERLPIAGIDASSQLAIGDPPVWILHGHLGSAPYAGQD